MEFFFSFTAERQNEHTKKKLKIEMQSEEKILKEFIVLMCERERKETRVFFLSKSLAFCD